MADVTYDGHRVILRNESAAQTEGENAMAAGLRVDHDVGRWMQDRSQKASPDLLREMIKTLAEALMAADAEAL